MPNIGDTKTLFGRTYIYKNPDSNLGPSVWQLAARDASFSGEDDDAVISYGSAVLDVTSVPVLRGMLLYFTSSGTLKAALANNVLTSQVVGVALNGGNPGQTITFTNSVRLDMSNANLITDDATVLTPGTLYYLSAVNAGNWTSTPETTQTGNVVIQCGQAVAEDFMAVEVQPLVVI